MAVGEYASVISLIQDLNQIERLRDRGKIDFNAELLQKFEVTLRSLVSFLEETNSRELSSEIETLIRQISPAAVEAQFILGRLVVDQFPGAIRSEVVPSLSHALNEVLQKLEFIDQELKKLMSEKDVMRMEDPDYSDLVAIEDVQFEWEDELNWAIDKLTSYEESCQVISICGKAGVDMTAFARSLYNRDRIQNRFGKWMWWFTISEKYNVKEVLQVILGESCSGEASELGTKVHQKLFNCRYFVVLDDVQEIKAWEEINMHLPKCGNRSRILVTTRNLDVANASTGDETNICALGYNRRLYALKKTDACPNEIAAICKEVAKLPFVRFKHNITKVVGFGKKLEEVINYLTSRCAELQVISIVGMGGIGKTTLAQLVLNHERVHNRFDIHMWGTVSKNYDLKAILQDLLKDESNHLSDRELAIRLHEKLYGERYLIILDDIWDIDAWNSLQEFFPNNRLGSRILVTTRYSRVSEECTTTNGGVCRLEPWDDSRSWACLREMIFGEDDCPVDLKEIGKKIAKACGGLPLSLVAIAGVLSKSKMTASSWESILKNIKNSSGLIEGHHGLKVLSTSYYALPMHLKPCFLYFRNFHEDAKIRLSVLFREWIAEGYVQSAQNKTIPEIANEYFDELVARNLVLIVRRNSFGEITKCGVHDLVLELCIRESAKVAFPPVPRSMVPWFKEKKTCFMCFCYVLDGKGERICMPQIDEAISSYATDILVCEKCKNDPSLEKLLVVNFLDKKFPTTLRFIDSKSDFNEANVPLSTLLYFWDLQFIILNLDPDYLVESDVEFLGAIWDMPQLRYVDIGLVPLPSPPPKANSSSFTVLSELQELSAYDLVLSDELIERIPNVESLKLRHSHFSDSSDWCLHLLARFQRLESLCIDGFYDLSEYKVCFPPSLRKLTLNCVNICWDKTMQIVGSLENLHALNLINVCDDKTSEWKMSGNKFTSLKTLVIRNTDLNIWEVDDDARMSFPLLESLVLEGAKNLEISIDFGYILSLRAIHLNGCGERARISSRKLMRWIGGRCELYFDGKLDFEWCRM